MTPAEQGFLLLSSHLGDPNRKVLTQAQLRTLSRRVSGANRENGDRELQVQDLVALGYDWKMAGRIVQLLSDTEQLQWYLKEAARKGCFPVTRISPNYPFQLFKKLGFDTPAILWMKGDAKLLDQLCIALVGSRELRKENMEFAREAGRQIGLQGYTLISGNARGADTVAQEACLEAGGNVISVVADSLQEHPLREHVLYISEDDYDLPFSTQRALSRNRVIHCMASITLVAQCTLEKGGTWDGTTKNLRHNWSEVFCFCDNSAAYAELCLRGANKADLSSLNNLASLLCYEFNRLDI